MKMDSSLRSTLINHNVALEQQSQCIMCRYPLMRRSRRRFARMMSLSIVIMFGPHPLAYPATNIDNPDHDATRVPYLSMCPIGRACRLENATTPKHTAASETYVKPDELPTPTSCLDTSPADYDISGTFGTLKAGLDLCFRGTIQVHNLAWV